MYCPICNTIADRFEPKGKRKNAKCPSCGSLERHRLFWVWFARFASSVTRLLHVAPESFFVHLLSQRLHSDYVTKGPDGRKFDVRRIPYPAVSFDVVLCFHVLEHVIEDRTAMMEMYRVLKPGGWAAVMVPISAAYTIEDTAETDSTPGHRLERYGQKDHVRRYGLDVVDRLSRVGFDVEVIRGHDLTSAVNVKRLGIDRTLFVCRRPLH